MRALIPVAGIGTKLRPHTHTQPKPLIPVAGKPILGHIIDNLLRYGVDDMVFVVGYLREKITEYVQTHYTGKIKMEFVVQEPRRGLAHALWVAVDHIRQADEILIVLGDTIFGDDTRKILAAEGSILAVHPVEDPREFGVAVLDSRQYVRRLAEKPPIPTSNLALVGMYKISEAPLLVQALEAMMGQGIAEDRDYPLTDALMQMIQLGAQFRVHHVENWFDCGRKQSLLLTNRILLGRMPADRSYVFPNTVIIPPVHIAEGCEIKNSIIGPYVAIAEHARINNSILSNSILGAYTRLESIILQGSVIGNDTSLKGKSISINIGDNAEIDFEQGA